MSADRRKKSITGTMAAALAMAHEHGGELARFAGGYWSYRDCPRHSHNGNPEESFGTPTIEALVARGRMSYSEYREGRNGRFPVVAQIITESASVKTGEG